MIPAPLERTMGEMPKILALLAFVLTLLVAHGALACDGSDRRVGPVCVERTVYKIGKSGRGVAYEKVYFEDDVYREIVWEGNGYVDAASKKKLDVIEQRFIEGKGLEDVHVFYYWNGQKFVEKNSR